MFQLSKSEYESLISQSDTSKKTGRGGARKMPHAFTEQRLLQNLLRYNWHQKRQRKG